MHMRKRAGIMSIPFHFPPYFMTYLAAPERYDAIPYRRVGRSGLVLPAISLGLWHNFGDSTPIDVQRKLLRTAFATLRQRGLAHVDLKVVADNAPAIRLYRRLGMIEAPL